MSSRLSAAPPDGYFAWLDPLRGFAALSVLAAHLVMLAGTPIPTWYPLAWFRIGFLGVDLFFAISGAVILFSLSSLMRRYGANFRRVFLGRRLARVVPLYLLTGTAFVLFAKPEILQRADALQVVLAHLFFVQNLFPWAHGAINGPSWTLAVEMQFYLLILLIGPWLLRLPLWGLAMLGFGVALAWRTAVWWHLARMPDADTNLVFIASTQLPGVLDEFVAGMVALRWVRQREASGRLSTPAFALGLSLLALLAWCGAIAWMHRHALDYWTHPASVIALRSALALAVGVSVAAALSWPAPKRGMAALRLSGDLSYGLYLWHMGVLLLWLGIWPAATSWTFAGTVLATSVMLSLVAWHGLERPAQAWARRHERCMAARGTTD
jgi:peptidoglycan/LPS O-acetylase OafA/YrhL